MNPPIAQLLADASRPEPRPADAKPSAGMVRRRGRVHALGARARRPLIGARRTVGRALVSVGVRLAG